MHHQRDHQQQRQSPRAGQAGQQTAQTIQRRALPARRLLGLRLGRRLLFWLFGFFGVLCHGAFPVLEDS